MSRSPLDVLAVGNAIVDVISQIDDELLYRHNLTKGTMKLIDSDQATKLCSEMPPGVETSGGSAANTATGIAMLGGNSAFVGKVKNDRLGEVFTRDLRSTGVAFESLPTTDGPGTARSIILVTPDAERTMNTFLGASTTLGPKDIDSNLISNTKIVYLEGYLWDPENAKIAFRKASLAAKAAGRKVAFTLSDAFCVERWRYEFMELIDRHVDILFANELELLTLYETDDLDQAAEKVRHLCSLVAITRSKKGSVLLSDNKNYTIPAEPIARVIDTTGAGDLYAAGVLFGLISGESIPTCGRIGAICAAEIIKHYGARPKVSLKSIVAGKLRR